MEVENWKVKYGGISILILLSLVSLYFPLTFLNNPEFFVGIVYGIFLVGLVTLYRKLKNVG